ncbi:MAG: SEC-C domain-containing protein [Candidatus Thiodiazotropha sp. (ex Lucina pensylvanica)]|nr:SEC-C domain-containing protein [Candidatus Thiodiazotropha sp. (ex Lucina pensylvanica)]MBT3050681.1 SEC-C domain-containing protein [Candidatus Thiodiazotropha sp. (ex Codakia orbicularis)]
MNRKPPKNVREELRQEVGFGCPIEECANPYLQWHHFDPPWSKNNHHNPEGMIALCSIHHDKADAGAYTADQLRAYKKNKVQSEKIKGKFDWLRNDLLVVVGGIFYYKTLFPLKINNKKIVWFNRDEEGYLRLNIELPSTLPEDRIIMEDNIWTNIGCPCDIHSPPSGKELKVAYSNGDYIEIKFTELSDSNAVLKRFGHDPAECMYQHFKDIKDELKPFDFKYIPMYPITSVEINLTVAGTDIKLIPKGKVGNANMKNCMFAGETNGLNIKTNVIFRQNPSLLPYTSKSRLELCPCGSGQRFKHCHGKLI